MSGQQRRGPGQRPDDRAQGSAPGHDAHEAEASGPGNAAFAQQIGPETGEDGAVLARPASEGAEVLPAEIVRDTARPIVERGRLALEIEPIAPSALARFVAVLERSGLDPEQRDRLIDKLRTDDAAARGIGDAMARAFPGEGGVRGALAEVLDAVDRALLGGVADGAGWRFVDVRVPLPDAGASASADALVRALADQLASPESREVLGESPGERVVRYCHAVSVLLLWDDEEDEESAIGVDAELV